MLVLSLPPCSKQSQKSGRRVASELIHAVYWSKIEEEALQACSDAGMTRSELMVAVALITPNVDVSLDRRGVQRQLHFPTILPQAKILLSKVGGSSN